MNTPDRCILLVEDDANDVFFLEYAFEKCGLVHPLKTVVNGKQAVDYLAGKEPYADRRENPFPCLVLLDLNLPLMSGLEVLKWIADQKTLAGLPVIVLTSSQDERDVCQSYDFGAASFLVKPIRMEDRLRLARALKDFWLDLNRIPVSLGPQWSGV